MTKLQKATDKVEHAVEFYCEARHKQGHSTYNVKTLQAKQEFQLRLAELIEAAKWKDHDTREFINALTHVAMVYEGTGQMRERIAQVVHEHLKGVHDSEAEAAEVMEVGGNYA